MNENSSEENVFYCSFSCAARFSLVCMTAMSEGDGQQ
jgi:hypothetical protein